MIRFSLCIPAGGVAVPAGATDPETACADLAGKRVKLSDLRGKVVVLDFWATWCGPRRAMTPHARERVKGMGGRPFVLVSVSGDDAREAVAAFVERTPMPWSHRWDDGMKAAGRWEAQGFPTRYVVDHAGVIRHKTTGYDPKDEKMAETLAELVKAAQVQK